MSIGRIDALAWVREHLWVEIQEIQDQLTAAFPEYESVEPHFDNMTQMCWFVRVGSKELVPRRVTLRVSAAAVDDYSDDDSFRAAVSKAIGLMKSAGGARIVENDEGVLVVHSENPL